jgi:hypothetical protein
MTYRWFGLAVLLSAMPLGAGTVIVSSQVVALFGTGDELSISVSSKNFGVHAAEFGLPEYPTQVEFTLVSAPEDSPGQFDAVLESGDDSVSVSFGAALSFVSGIFQGSRYSGPVSVLEGTLHLSEAQSQEIFGSSPAVLMLLNTGPAVTLGLPPYTLQQDVDVSLGGGGLSVGAAPGKVTLTESSDPSGGSGLHSDLLLGGGGFGQLDPPPDPHATPEPCSGVLLLGGGALLWALARRRRS